MEEANMSTSRENGDIDSPAEPTDVTSRDIKSPGHYIIHRLRNVIPGDFCLYIEASTGREWTCAEFTDKVFNVACCLLDLHQFKAGDAIYIRFDNSVEGLILAVATLIAGGVVSGNHPKDPYDSFLYKAERVLPKFLFCRATEADWANRLQADLGIQVEAILMGHKTGDCAETKLSHLDDLLCYDSSKSKSLKSLPLVSDNQSSALAFVTLSSGTTGAQKVVPFSYENLRAELAAGELETWNTDARILSVGAFYCPSGRLINFFPIKNKNTSVVILPSFDPHAVLSAIEKCKVTLIYSGAAAFYSLITHPNVDQYDLSSLRIVSPSGAKINYVEKMREFCNKWPHITFVGTLYGTSEVSLVTSRLNTVEGFFEDPHNCGKLFSNAKAKIVDRCTGERVTGANVSGMLHVRSATQIQGYYDGRQTKGRSTPTADGTRSPFIREPSAFDAEGYYITGDIAYFNENDELYIVGREKELMSCRDGKKVLPHELEELIEMHPAVSTACVLGIDDQRQLTQHCPRAFVAVKSSCYDEDCELELANDEKTNEYLTLDHEDEILVHKGTEHKLCSLSTERRRTIAENLMQFVNARTTWFKHLTGGIVILDRIPSLTSGKMDKQYLRSLSLDQVEIYGDRSC